MQHRFTFIKWYIYLIYVYVTAPNRLLLRKNDSQRWIASKPFDNIPVTRLAATWPLVLELIFFLSNNVRMSKATEMCLRDHNSNNCTHSGNVCYCTYMVNNDYDKLRSFSRLYMTLFRHRTCTYLHGRADRFLVSVSNGQVAALSDWAYYQ